jgi:hypothetical protein
MSHDMPVHYRCISGAKVLDVLRTVLKRYPQAALLRRWPRSLDEVTSEVTTDKSVTILAQDAAHLGGVKMS